MVNTKNEKLIEEYLFIRKSNNKSEVTLKNEKITLTKLSDFIGNNFKDVTETNLQNFINTYNGSLRSRDLIGSRLIQFYRWIEKCDKRDRPTLMKWFEFTTKKQLDKVKDPDKEKYLISSKEYKKIINATKDVHGMWEALWETYYLSGGRRDEVRHMRIKDVEINGNKVKVTLNKSKTKPRKVPMAETPQRLIRWLNNHPNKDNPEAPLWISYSTRTYLQKLGTSSINNKFSMMKKYNGIKDTLSIHCFRKTRASIMYNTEVGKDTSLMAEFFGWSILTAEERREEYDLRTNKELMEKIFNGNLKPLETFDTLKQQKELLEQKHEVEINRLKKQIDDLTKVYENDNAIISSAYEQKLQLQEKRIQRIEKLLG